MIKHTQKSLQLDLARTQEQNITNKYSDNYVMWSKACDKVNTLKNKYNKMVREYNFDNGMAFFT